MEWQVEFHPAFEAEFDELPRRTKTAIAARALLLGQFGRQLPRPHADTLHGSKHANMKELRCQADDGVWRVAYAFDPRRRAILLVAGNKSGGSERRFYRWLIATADKRFDEHLHTLKGTD